MKIPLYTTLSLFSFIIPQNMQGCFFPTRSSSSRYYKMKRLEFSFLVLTCVRVDGETAVRLNDRVSKECVLSEIGIVGAHATDQCAGW